MAQRKRDERGRFVKGTSGNPATIINGEVAKDFQARSVVARRENKTLREAMLEALAEPGGGGYTKMEILVRKAMENHRNGKLSFLDLKFLSSVLGEDRIKVETSGPQVIVVSQQAVDASKKWGK